MVRRPTMVTAAPAMAMAGMDTVVPATAMAGTGTVVPATAIAGMDSVARALDSVSASDAVIKPPGSRANRTNGAIGTSSASSTGASEVVLAGFDYCHRPTVAASLDTALILIKGGFINRRAPLGRVWKKARVVC